MPRKKISAPASKSELLTPAEVSVRYGKKVAVGTLRNWRWRKSGPPFVHIGRRVFYPIAQLLAWESAQTSLAIHPERS